MYGKLFSSMYEGSMYGAGLPVFAVWGYALAHARASRVELNSKKLSDTLGGTMEEVDKAIEFLMQADPDSRHKTHEGRRLVREGQFQYYLPSWEDYQKIRNEDGRREYNRIKQAEYRAKAKKPKKKKGVPISDANERAYAKAYADGNEAEMERLTNTAPDK